MKTSDRSIAQRVRARVLRSSERLFMAEDFDDIAGDAYSAVGNELQRLRRAGELERVRRGVYWRGTKSRFGMSPPPSGDVLRETTGAPTGVSGWAATNALGLSTQVPPVEQLSVPHRIPRGYNSRTAVSRAARVGRESERLNGLEVTFLEALEGWDKYVEADADFALARFADVTQRKDFRADRVARASRTEPPAVRERLRAVLGEAGFAEQADRVPRARDPRTRQKALRVLSA